MKAELRALAGGFRAEALFLKRARLFVALTLIQAVTFLFLVSLFGLTGSRAPTALVSDDNGSYAKMFVANLEAAHHSFALRPMAKAAAMEALHRGALVAVIEIPPDFSDTIGRGGDTVLQVTVDNVDVDMTEDIQRALPSAIVAFGRQVPFPGVRVQVAEHDFYSRDTGFIPYLIVSGLILDLFVIAGSLSAATVAREFERGTIRLLATAPVAPVFPLAGRVLAAMTAAAVAMLLPIAIVLFGYKLIPRDPLEAAGTLLVSLVVFSCLGVLLGVALKRTLPVASLIFGLSLPLYLCSGSLEPQRFDGPRLWALAHCAPTYYAVGLLEQAFHGYSVTPESEAVNFAALLGWASAALLAAAWPLKKQAA